MVAILTFEKFSCLGKGEAMSATEEKNKLNIKK